MESSTPVFSKTENPVTESPSSSRFVSSPRTPVPDSIPAESNPDSEPVMSPATTTRTPTENNRDIISAPDSTELRRSNRTIRKRIRFRMSLLDHIVHNDCVNNLEFGVIKTNITDHFATYF